MADKLQHVETTLNRLSEVLFANQETSHVHHTRDTHPGDCQVVSLKLARLEFPHFTSDDPREWLSRVYQFFEFQHTPETQKITLASYHLEGEANQWWEWVRHTYQTEDLIITWLDFEEELLARFGLFNCENFDEDLSRIRQLGSRRDYQKEFERLGNQSFIVKVAKGEQLQCQDRFDKVPISIQGVCFSLTLYSLPLIGLNLVMGIQWLERLGSVICNWKKLTMDFTWDNQPRRLVRVNGHPIETTSFKKISKALRPEATALALCMSIGQHAAPIPNSMQELLSHF
ncbi:hypothetical protein F0562_025260 [Nyssa sinensis]|uniref:Retrotransposon gag domain-containing protein n=1 Tax=Nyssa sinensis TaxID=561372 RepID=A0A5J5BHM2_9ASTE|nr:hypothetical protein F0562_025260 [Nyssa sinensis]